MKDKALRSKLVDCLKWYKKQHGYWYSRPVEDKEFFETKTDIDSISLQALVNESEENGHDVKNVFVNGYSVTDYDGYLDNYVSLESMSTTS